jgi:hypothetical protein
MDSKRAVTSAAAAVVLAAATLGSARAFEGPPVQIVVASVTATEAQAGDKESVVEFLKRYESTLASGRIERIVSLYANFDPNRRAELDDYFQRVISDLQVRLDHVRINVDGDQARVKFARTDSFNDRETGRHVEKAVAVARRLERQGRGWRMVLDEH